MPKEIYRLSSEQVLGKGMSEKDFQAVVNNAIKNQGDVITKHLDKNGEIKKDFKRLEDWVLRMLVRASTSAQLSRVYDTLSSDFCLNMSTYNQEFGEKLRLRSVMGQSLDNDAKAYGTFLEDGIFGTGAKGNSSPTGDIVNLLAPKYEELELKAIIHTPGKEGWQKLLKVSRIRAHGTFEELTSGKSKYSALVTYRILMKMQNLFVMEFQGDPARWDRVDPIKATLFYELIVKNVEKSVRETMSNKGSSIIKVAWDSKAKPSENKDEILSRPLVIKMNLESLFDIDKAVSLYLRRKIFFDNHNLDSGISSKEFFGTLKHMGFLDKD